MLLDVGHVGVAYTVRVKVARRKEYRRFGNFDDNGSKYLLDVVHGYLPPGFTAQSADKLRAVHCMSSTARPPDLEIIASHGLTGVGWDILRASGDRDHIYPPDTTLATCGALFHLPRNQSLGFLIVHINNSRRIKTLLTNNLIDHFKTVYPTLRLEIEPCVNKGILASAISRNAVEKLHLVKYEHPSDRGNSDTDKWVAGSVPARIELILNARGKNRLQTALLRRYLNPDDKGAFREIISFGGLGDFDQAKAEVELPDGRTRLVNLSNPDGGPATTFDLTDIEETEDGDPTEDSIFTSLRSMLADVQGDYPS